MLFIATANICKKQLVNSCVPCCFHRKFAKSEKYLKVDKRPDCSFFVSLQLHKPNSHVSPEREKPEIQKVSLGETIKVQTSNLPVSERLCCFHFR
jgi:hypothetical protein